MINTRMPALRAQSTGCTSSASRFRIVCGANTSGNTNSRFTKMPNQVTRLYHFARRSYWFIPRSPSSPGHDRHSQRLHVLDQGILCLRRELRAVKMAAVSVARDFGIVIEEASPVRFGDVRDKADFFTVVEIIAAKELTRPLLRRFQKVAQGRHRAIVQVRRSSPDTV